MAGYAAKAKNEKGAQQVKSINFIHSGVSGIAEVERCTVFVRYAGAAFHLSAAKDGLRKKVMSELVKAGLLPKVIKSN
ncbi:hypothetical protein D3C81_1718040 [compost metagenome]